METFSRKAVDALNTAKYEAIPILEYLQSLNRKRSDNPIARKWFIFKKSNPQGKAVAGPFESSNDADAEMARWPAARQNLHFIATEVVQPAKRKANPMATKKPSAAQLAARKLFAQRAKAGYFERGVHGNDDPNNDPLFVRKKQMESALRPARKSNPTDPDLLKQRRRIARKTQSAARAAAKSPVRQFWCVDKSYRATGNDDWVRVGYFDDKAEAVAFGESYHDSAVKRLRTYLGRADKMP